MKSTFYAHVRVGTCNVAIPAADIVQAVEQAKTCLTPLPRREERRCGALVGVVDYKGGVVPVVALDRWVPIGESTDRHEKRILILRAGPSFIAVQIDALMGVKRIASSALQTVCQDAADEELFETVIPATAERPMLCLLHVSRLMTLAAAWCEQAELGSGAPNSDAVAESTATRSRSTAKYAVFTIGDQLWALPASAVAQVARTPQAELRLAGQKVCGIGTWAKRKVPFVDLGFLHDRAGTARPWMAVVAQGPLAIGLVADSCDRVVQLTSEDIFPTPGDEHRGGTATVPGMGNVFVLDIARLFEAIPEATISQVRAEVDWKGTARQVADAAGQVGTGTGRHASAGAEPDAIESQQHSDYLVFEADRPYASPIGGVIGVTTLTETAIDDLSHGRRAAVAWRGETLGVVNMPQIDGGKAAFAPRLAVVVGGAGQHARKSAIAVRSLTRWLPARSAHRSVMRMQSLGEVPVVTPAGATRSESLVVVDLAQMAFLLD